MKAAEQKEAVRLRREDGLSVGEIAVQLKVAKSSVSRWVREVPLSEEQIARLRDKNPLYNRQLAASGRIKERSREVRRQYQEAGRQKAREGDPLHIAGCMLYWAEGSKERNLIAFTNSDPNMMRYFLSFLYLCYDVRPEDVAVHIHCFDDCLPVGEIEAYWLKMLELPASCLRKTVVNRYSRQSQRKRCGLLKHGTCRIHVFRTSIVQMIYGAIQEYTGVTTENWLD